MKVFVLLVLAFFAFATVSDAAACQKGYGKWRGLKYRGRVSKTKSGHKCQAWNSTKTHKHGFFKHGRVVKNHRGKGLGKHNMCRNPDGEGGAWCYTTNPKKRWEHCAVPSCKAKACQSGKGKWRGLKYRGGVSMTKSGHKCQAWNSIKPHKHGFLKHGRVVKNHRGKGLGHHNKCRNPDGEGGAWCYTTNPKKRWEHCGVPSCGTVGCQKGGGKTKGVAYRGKVSVTRSGRKCQKWTQQRPHKHNRTPRKYKGKGLGNHNFCRNPDGSGAGAWCYTVDKRKRWEPCAVPVCKARASRGGGSVCHVHCGSARYVF